MAPGLFSYGGGFVILLCCPLAGFKLALSNEALWTDKIIGKGRQIVSGMIANETNMSTIVAPATAMYVSTASSIGYLYINLLVKKVKRGGFADINKNNSTKVEFIIMRPIYGLGHGH